MNPSPADRPASEPEQVPLRYDAATLDAHRHFAQADADLAPARGTPRAWVAFKRYAQYAKLLSVQAERIHQIYLHSKDGLYCTCGLIVPGRFTNPLRAPGHLDFTTREPVDLVLGVAECTYPAELADRRYSLHCHRCNWDSPPLPLPDARLLASTHHHDRTF